MDIREPLLSLSAKLRSGNFSGSILRDGGSISLRINEFPAYTIQ
jgi:hypothetical protein